MSPSWTAWMWCQASLPSSGPGFLLRHVGGSSGDAVWTPVFLGGVRIEFTGGRCGCLGTETVVVSAVSLFSYLSASHILKM